MATAPTGLLMDMEIISAGGPQSDNYRLYATHGGDRGSLVDGSDDAVEIGTNSYTMTWFGWATLSSDNRRPFISWDEFSSNAANNIRNTLSGTHSLYAFALGNIYEFEFSDSELHGGQGLRWNTTGGITRPASIGNGTSVKLLIAEDDQSGQTRRYASGVPDNVLNSGVVLTAGDEEITLSWGAASDATGYDIERSTDGSTWGNRISDNEPPYVSMNLTNDQRYYFRIRAKNANGASDWTNGSHNSIPMEPPLPDVYIGSNTVDDWRLGSMQVDALYLGSERL